MLNLKNFGARKGYPPETLLDSCFFCRFLSQTSPHHPKISTRNGFCFDRVHVKEVPSKYVHPKTGTLSPQLSQLKVLCENVEFEEFWGSERVPTPHRFLFFLPVSFPDITTSPKNLYKKWIYALTGSMLRYICKVTFISKLENNHPNFPCSKYYVKMFILKNFGARKRYPP